MGNLQVGGFFITMAVRHALSPARGGETRKENGSERKVEKNKETARPPPLAPLPSNAGIG